MPARLYIRDDFFFLLEFTYQTKDAATGAASIIVDNEGICFARWNIVSRTRAETSIFYPIPVDLLPYPPLQGLMYGLSNLNIYVSLYLYFPS